MSAPASNESGSGGSVTGSGSLKVVAMGPACDDDRGAAYAVHGSTADSVLFGLTIAASIVAAKQQIPTISVSVENAAEDFRRNGNYR